jgi:hypothetical protein
VAGWRGSSAGRPRALALQPCLRSMRAPAQRGACTQSPDGAAPPQDAREAIVTVFREGIPLLWLPGVAAEPLMGTVLARPLLPSLSFPLRTCANVMCCRAAEPGGIISPKWSFNLQHKAKLVSAADVMLNDPTGGAFRGSTKPALACVYGEPVSPSLDTAPFSGEHRLVPTGCCETRSSWLVALWAWHWA